MALTLPGSIATLAPIAARPRFSYQCATSVRMGLMVANSDGIAANAIAAGATEVYPVADQDYGYRLGHIIDPYGHHWEICRPL